MIRTSFAALALAVGLLAPAVLTTPTSLRTVEKYHGEVNPDSYIVKLVDETNRTAHLAWLAQHLGSDSIVTHDDWNPDFFNGFAGKFSSHVLNILRNASDVALIAEDGIASISVTSTQTNAPWGLGRISQNGRLLNQNANDQTFTYMFDSSAGSGVDIYVVDTGIYTSHADFGGRARWGATFGGYPNADGNGHGTHVSGTAAGAQFGVAKVSASLIAVKVLGDNGSGAFSDVISGLNWVYNAVQASNRPSVATMSLVGSAYTPIDSAVASLTNAGIHVTVAAGNGNTDAGNTSPARAPSANTIGATSIADARASFSNYGSVVDLFAPGQDITSAWIGNPTATNTISGTSMATPHVAGLVAYLIRLRGNVSPAAMSSYLNSLSVKGVISGIPSGTINALARNTY